MTLSVLIPTYRRIDTLIDGLDALKAQERPADQIIIVVRDTDTETQQRLASYEKAALPIEIVVVSVVGVIAAMNAGLEKITGEITVLTDDDTTAWPDWLKRIELAFQESTVGGVGGKDWQKHATGEKPDVGVLTNYGKAIGNHHLGIGPSRSVDFLKGANAAYRTQPLREIGFDTRLLGSGAQVHWEMGLCFAFKAAGWTLLYDPEICVDHHIAPRFDSDDFHRTGQFHPESYFNMVYNETLFLWYYLSPLRRVLFFLWAMLIGTRSTPGLAIWVLEALTRKQRLNQLFAWQCRARFAAMTAAHKDPPKRISGPIKT
jgi:glycosyltransferase involved in cell wall biosynthesis